ncbi:MAG: flagellar export chaperone FliS [Nitrospirae bacterium]|nr:flagellar export chaperone FliS [Nitrospirota bacterium]
MITNYEIARKLYSNAQTAYIKADVENSSPVDLVIKLYDGAITYLSSAIRDINGGKINNNNYIRKGIAIIDELLQSLNIKEGGEIASSLQDLYLYMLIELTKANMSSDAARIEHALKILINLKEGWTQIREGEFRRNAHSINTLTLQA